ncbi:MAG: sterol desaturase family protein [Frankiaceae bacterium]|nr:sterol desaturase family protein [Frankiaceae bacterium]
MTATPEAPTADEAPARRGRQVVRVKTLKDAARLFARHTSPRILLGASAVVIAARVAVGEWSLADVIVAAVIVGAQPFTEWVIHVYILHVQPGRHWLNNAFDRAAGIAHRLHHQDPYDLRWQFIHPRVTIGGLVFDALVLAVFRTPAALTGVLAAIVLTTLYEWVHFLIHTDVPAKHAPYKQLHRAHRLHHYRNEGYWLGVTNHLGDRVLRTYPAKDDVPVSPTATTALAGLKR